MPEVLPTKPKAKASLPLRTAPWPEDARELRTADLLNLQICACGHDRCSHSNFIGRGKDRNVITNCPHAGRCGVSGCGCNGFALGEVNTDEGWKRAALERETYPAFPSRQGS